MLIINFVLRPFLEERMQHKINLSKFGVLFVLIALLSTGLVAFAEEGQPQSDYYTVETVELEDGTVLERMTIAGPPVPPIGNEAYQETIVKDVPATSQIISGVPAFDWSFGCSATSAAMIAGYYDRNGYSNMYAGPTNGGVMPLDNSHWPDWVDGAGDTRHQCPLSATHQGLDGRTTRGHVDDYWVEYGSTDDDPFYGNWTEHTYGDCTGDYMYTNQTTNYGNSDGATGFWGYNSGDILYCSTLEGMGGDYEIDGTVGFKNFYESRGYTVNECYYQKTDNQYTGGFSFADYKAEIDSGNPVMLHVEGHTMVGTGYDDSSNTVYLHDTWDYSQHSMTWGSSYSGMAMVAVSIVHLEPPPALTPPADFDGDGETEVSVYRPSNGNWYIYGQSYTAWGQPGDLPAAADYDGDGTVDVAVYRPSNGKWYVMGNAPVKWGQSGDVPVPCDYDGDGSDDIAVYRPGNGNWYVYGQSYQSWGLSGDIPVPADYDSDGVCDIVVYRPNNGKWYQMGETPEKWGMSGDIPIPGDWDGDGDYDIAVYRPSNGNWYIMGQSYTSWGMMDDIPVPGDYNADGTFDIAVLRPDNGKWYIKDIDTVKWYASGDFPLPVRDTNADGDAYE
jgi:hypothetical protein